MKKLLSLVAIALLSVGVTIAQTSVTVPVSKQTAKTATAVKKDVKKVETKTTTAVKKDAKAVQATTKATGAKLKADGTPDMRYAENKAKKVVAGPTKKDGTADMRYKANKVAATATAKKN